MGSITFSVFSVNMGSNLSLWRVYSISNWNPVKEFKLLGYRIRSLDRHLECARCDRISRILDGISVHSYQCWSLWSRIISCRFSCSVFQNFIFLESVWVHRPIGVYDIQYSIWCSIFFSNFGAHFIWIFSSILVNIIRWWNLWLWYNGQIFVEYIQIRWAILILISLRLALIIKHIDVGSVLDCRVHPFI